MERTKSVEESRKRSDQLRLTTMGGKDLGHHFFNLQHSQPSGTIVLLLLLVVVATS